MCMVCGKSTSEESQREVTGQTAHGANEVDPSEGTRRFHDGKWYYFTSMECRSLFMANPDKYISE